MSTVTKTAETFAQEFARLEASVRERAARQGMDAEQYTKVLVDQALRPVRRKPEELTPEEHDAAEWRLLRHAGKGRSNDPNAADNDRIDADLAREYGRGL